MRQSTASALPVGLPARGPLRQRNQRRVRLCVPRSAEGCESTGCQCRLVDRCGRVLFQEAEEPPCCDAGAALRSLDGDQRRQFERFEQADAADLVCRCFGD